MLIVHLMMVAIAIDVRNNTANMLFPKLGLITGTYSQTEFTTPTIKSNKKGGSVTPLPN